MDFTVTYTIAGGRLKTARITVSFGEGAEEVRCIFEESYPEGTLISISSGNPCSDSRS